VPNAIKPDVFISIPEPVEETVVEETEDANTAEEAALYHLQVNPNWKVFERVAKRAIKDLGKINKGAIAQGLPMEEIGRNAVVIAMVEDEIEKLLNRVADATEPNGK
jgi:hypothetical protein